MRRLAVAVLVVAAACGTGLSGAQSTPSAFTPVPGVTPLPSPTPPPVTSLAVLVDLFAGTHAYNVALVAGDGRVVGRAHASKRASIADAAELPYVSASNSRLYFLDGDRTVRYLKGDGSRGLAATVPGSPRVHAAFAVSPDDLRIAVALLDYSMRPVKLTLYVSDLSGANRKVVFTSTTAYAWPVAWHAGRVVLANFGAPPFASLGIGSDPYWHPYGANPYGAVNYSVVDPDARSVETMAGTAAVTGLLSTAGTATMDVGLVDWTGANHVFGASIYGIRSAVGSLSPHGRGIAFCCADGHLLISTADGIRWLQDTGGPADWVGWLDGNHIITGYYQRNAGTPAVIDIGYVAELGVYLDRATPVDAHGFVAAILPGGTD